VACAVVRMLAPLSCSLPRQVAKLIAGGPAASSGLVLEGDLLVAARNPLDPGWTDFAGLPLAQVYSWELVLAFAVGRVGVLGMNPKMSTPASVLYLRLNMHRLLGVCPCLEGTSSSDLPA